MNFIPGETTMSNCSLVPHLTADDRRADWWLPFWVVKILLLSHSSKTYMNIKNGLIYSKAIGFCLEFRGRINDLSFFFQLKMAIREEELWGWLSFTKSSLGVPWTFIMLPRWRELVLHWWIAKANFAIVVGDKNAHFKSKCALMCWQIQRNHSEHWMHKETPEQGVAIERKSPDLTFS